MSWVLLYLILQVCAAVVVAVGCLAVDRWFRRRGDEFSATHN